MLVCDGNEDYACQIPCPAFCGDMFDTHSRQVHHWQDMCRVGRDARARPVVLGVCPFRAITGCQMKPTNRHASVHSGDQRGFVCQQCALAVGSRFDEILHARHYHQRRGGRKKTTTVVVCVVPSFPIGTALQIVVVARSSGFPPARYGRNLRERWQAVQSHLGGALHAYRNAFNAQEGGATFHYAATCPTRSVPRMSAPKMTSSKNSSSIGYIFSQNVTSDLVQCQNPTLITLGIDGFTCNVKLLLPWLREMVPFRWVVVFHKKKNIPKKLQDLPFERNGNFWLSFSSSDLLRRLEVIFEEGQPPSNDLIDRVIRHFRWLQRWKKAKLNVPPRTRYGTWSVDEIPDSEDDADSEDGADSADSADDADRLPPSPMPPVKASLPRSARISAKGPQQKRLVDYSLSDDEPPSRRAAPRLDKGGGCWSDQTSIQGTIERPTPGKASPEALEHSLVGIPSKAFLVSILSKAFSKA